MKTEKLRYWPALMLFVFAHQPLSAAYLKDPWVSLSPPVLTGGQVSFTLTCEAGVSYVIESSSNLQSWLPVLTNNDPEIHRTIHLQAPGDTTYYRAMRSPLYLFNAAIATTRNIDMNGKNFKTDSFDSADPNYSDNGLYPFGMLNKTKANGHILTDASFTNAFWFGRLEVKGNIRTGPTGSVFIGTNSSVGDRAWVESIMPGIQPGHLSNDMNTFFPAPALPPAPYLTPVKGTYIIDGVTYDYYLGSGWYKLNSLGTNNWKLYVGGDAKLWVYSDINMAGTDTIRIGTNASLWLFMSGGIARFGGNGVVNDNGKALSFVYFGLNLNTTLNFAFNSSVTGTVWAPNADFSIGGGGADTYHFVGAIIAKSLRLNGHYNFHFDEALSRFGLFR